MQLTEACSAEWVPVCTLQNFCCGYKGFWQAPTTTSSVENASGLLWLRNISNNNVLKLKPKKFLNKIKIGLQNIYTDFKAHDIKAISNYRSYSSFGLSSFFCFFGGNFSCLQNWSVTIGNLGPELHDSSCRSQFILLSMNFTNFKLVLNIISLMSILSWLLASSFCTLSKVSHNVLMNVLHFKAG